MYVPAMASTEKCSADSGHALESGYDLMRLCQSLQSSVGSVQQKHGKERGEGKEEEEGGGGEGKRRDEVEGGGRGGRREKRREEEEEEEEGDEERGSGKYK